jgi:hypothetical protein
MPHKRNADRRHHIPNVSFKIRNWRAYEAGLRRRVSLTLWLEDAAAGMLADHWTLHGQARYTGAPIQTSLMLHAAFRLLQIGGLRYKLALHGIMRHPPRRRKRQMQCFKSPKQAQRFLPTHSRIHDHFQRNRHRIGNPPLPS